MLLRPRIYPRPRHLSLARHLIQPQTRRTMSSSTTSAAEAGKKIYFSSFEVTSQVFYKTPLSYALVNIKPILPGHVLVVPFRLVPRLTDLTPAELQDLFCAVQKVQKMLARKYFAPSGSSSDPSSSAQEGSHNQDPTDGARVLGGVPTDASFNIAIQDGREAGQTVPHVHVHIIPRLRGDEAGDEVYARLQAEEGNVGGGFWDREMGRRPVQEGKFPRIEDEDRKPREEGVMRSEADGYRALMEGV